VAWPYRGPSCLPLVVDLNVVRGAELLQDFDAQRYRARARCVRDVPDAVGRLVQVPVVVTVADLPGDHDYGRLPGGDGRVNRVEEDAVAPVLAVGAQHRLGQLDDEDLGRVVGVIDGEHDDGQPARS
jgi:hypothetical protein